MTTPPPPYAGKEPYSGPRRLPRRSSILGPLLLVALGVAFLLVQQGSFSAWRALAWFGRWWPGLLIFAGLVLLVEWAVDQREARTLPEGMYRPRAVGGGVIVLLLLLACAGLAAQGVANGFAWASHDGNLHGLDRVLGNRADADNDKTAPIAAAATLIVRNPHGDVMVTGDSSDGQVHVSAHSESYSWGDAENQRKLQQLTPSFSQEGKDLALTVAYVDGGSADLTVSVPHSISVTVNADHGDVKLDQIGGSATISANHGDVDVDGIEGDLQASINDDDASITIKSVKGKLAVNGHTGDMDISAVGGPLVLHGEFFGTTDVEHVAGSVDFQTSRTHFSAARVDDEFSVAKDSLEANGVVGPVVLVTRDKNITLDRLSGGLELNDKNGSIDVTATQPLGTISIQNMHGSVDLGVPPDAGFVATALVHNGDLEDDFHLTTQQHGEDKQARGTIGRGGPQVTLSTSDGDLTLRTSTVTSLPPTPTAPGALPQPPPPPAPPAPPKSYTF